MNKGQFVTMVNDDDTNADYGKTYTGVIEDVVDNWYTICCASWPKATNVLVQDAEDPKALYMGGREYGTKYKVVKVQDDFQFSTATVKRKPVV